MISFFGTCGGSMESILRELHVEEQSECEFHKMPATVTGKLSRRGHLKQRYRSVTVRRLSVKHSSSNFHCNGTSFGRGKPGRKNINWKKKEQWITEGSSLRICFFLLIGFKLQLILSACWLVGLLLFIEVVSGCLLLVAAVDTSNRQFHGLSANTSLCFLYVRLYEGAFGRAS